jgi:hypothetical protein
MERRLDGDHSMRIKELRFPTDVCRIHELILRMLGMGPFSRCFRLPLIRSRDPALGRGESD